MKKHDISNVKLDAEEQEINDAIEHGTLKSVPNLARRISEAKQIASNTLRKDARINIRIVSTDLNRLKQRAAFKGLPYQTFISSVLHEYAAGHFDSLQQQ